MIHKQILIKCTRGLIALIVGGIFLKTFVGGCQALEMLANGKIAPNVYNEVLMQGAGMVIVSLLGAYLTARYVLLSVFR